MTLDVTSRRIPAVIDWCALEKNAEEAVDYPRDNITANSIECVRKSRGDIGWEQAVVKEKDRHLDR